MIDFLHLRECHHAAGIHRKRKHHRCVRCRRRHRCRTDNHATDVVKVDLHTVAVEARIAARRHRQAQRVDQYRRTTSAISAVGRAGDGEDAAEVGRGNVGVVEQANGLGVLGGEQHEGFIAFRHVERRAVVRKVEGGADVQRRGRLIAIAVGDRPGQGDQIRRAQRARVIGVARVGMHHSPQLIERHAAGGRIERQREDHTARRRAAGHHRAQLVHRQGHRLVGQGVGQAAGDTSRLDAKSVGDRSGILDVVVVRVQEPVVAEGRREVGREARRGVGAKDALIHRQRRQRRRIGCNRRTVISKYKVETYIQRHALRNSTSIRLRSREHYQFIRSQILRLIRIARRMHHRSRLIQRHYTTRAIHTYREHQLVGDGRAAFHHTPAYKQIHRFSRCRVDQSRCTRHHAQLIAQRAGSSREGELT